MQYLLQHAMLLVEFKGLLSFTAACTPLVLKVYLKPKPKAIQDVSF